MNWHNRDYRKHRRDWQNWGNWQPDHNSNHADNWQPGCTWPNENDKQEKNDEQPDNTWFHHSRTWDSYRPVKRRFLFLRFLLFFASMMVIFIVIPSIIFKAIFQPQQDFSPWPGMWMPLVFVIPVVLAVVAAVIGGLAFRRFGSPLADLMAALDAVAGGDLNVRLKENTHGELGKMARSFNRMAEELTNAEQNRRNLTADVAHELRTPLHIIQGNLEGMLDGVYDPSAEQISATLDETRLLARLVADLQTLSLAEAGKLRLHFESISVIDVIEDTITSFNGLASENGIELKSDISGTDDELTISADPDRLSQVLNNLVSNAVRYTPQGGAITLRAEHFSEGVRLVVADTGSGISAEDLPHIFDRFWKAEQSRSRHERTGSGLGLAIARQLVQAHGGEIHAESEPGRGTRFIVEIPSSSVPG
jgi:signal transduction histidine kinase